MICTNSVGQNLAVNFHRILVVVILARCIAGDEPPGLRTRTDVVSARPGDVNIGFPFGVHGIDATGKTVIPWFVCSAIVMANFALDQINNRTDLLPNVTLGLTIVDTFNTPNQALEVSMLFVPGIHSQTQSTGFINESHFVGVDPNAFNIVGVVGPVSSAEAIAVSPLLGIYELPIIGLFATSDQLSDKSLYPYFTRLVSTDSFMTKALIDLANMFGWSYISIVYSEGAYGENGASQTSRWIRSSGPQYNICLAVSFRIPTAALPGDYSMVVDALMANSRARVVIAFLNFPDMFAIFPLLEQVAGAGQFLWMSADGFAGVTPLPLAKLLTGSIYVDHPASKIPDYKEYTYSSAFWDMKNIWIYEMWQKQYDCVVSDYASTSDKRCVFNVSLIDAICPFPDGGWELANRAYDSIYVMAHALHNLIAAECPNSFIDKTLVKNCIHDHSLLSYVLNVSMNGTLGSIKFDAEGNLLEDLDVKQILLNPDGTSVAVIVGKWSASTGLSLSRDALDWRMFSRNSDSALPDSLNMSNGTFLESICSKPCADTEYMISQSSQCCWLCATCRSNEFIISNRTGCKSCPPFTWPSSPGASSCVAIDPLYLHESNPVCVVMICSAMCGALFTLSLMVIYRVRRDHQLIKATSRELCYVMLGGTLIVSAVVILFVVKPDRNSICTARSLGFHFGINLIYAPLLVKNLRIYRLFSYAKQSNRRPAWTSTSWQMLFTFVVAAVEVCK